jgi:hypothetical protein
MGSAVVRCPVCRGASQVEAGALGFDVRCPRCDATLTAVEEVEVVAPVRPARYPIVPPAGPPERRRSRRPVRTDPPREHEPPAAPEPDHDPHRIPPGALPVSVLIGLALLPFAIPILWLAGPALVGEESMLSIATPSALALSASVLCLAVIYTVDWTPSTRVKGVLMLVSFAFFAAVSLYFLKKDLVEKFQKALGQDDRIQWRDFKQPAKDGGYSVRMPGFPVKINDQPIGSFPLALHKAAHRIPQVGDYEFVIGCTEVAAVVQKAFAAGKDAAKPGTDAWFDGLRDEIVAGCRGKSPSEEGALAKPGQGREWTIEIGEKQTIRMVRIYLIRGRLYYLAAERPIDYWDDEPAKYFFNSFDITK